MMRQYELVEKVRDYNPKVQEDLLNRAYVYAMTKHGTQKRKSGDPYFSHPLEVAGILTELKLDDSTVVAALLHDVVEDTDATIEEIFEMFGEDVGRLVEGLTKLERLDLCSKEHCQAENLLKLLIAVSKDLRVLLVKLADRLHNMRTIGAMSDEARARIAIETLDIYAPLAARVGLQEFREELETLAFKHVYPQHYKTITERLHKLKLDNKDIVSSVKNDLFCIFKRESIKAEVLARIKPPYSIFSKMQREHIGFEQLSDVYGFRIIVEDKALCYRVLGLIHTEWPMVPGRFKDYISTPRRNGYRSIHTTVITSNHQRVELQIRTFKMHQEAERGVIAHYLYKEIGNHVVATPEIVAETSVYDWLREMISTLEEAETPEDFLEHTKLELYSDQVFCFTPNGKLISLPVGATAIDFAYAVHTEVGNCFCGAKVNGKYCGAGNKLENGDEVEIITSVEQHPLPAWEYMATTGKAKSAIKRYLRKRTKQDNTSMGQHLLQQYLSKKNIELSESVKSLCLRLFSRNEIESLYEDIGSGKFDINSIVDLIVERYLDGGGNSKIGATGSGRFKWFNFGLFNNFRRTEKIVHGREVSLIKNKKLLVGDNSAGMNISYCDKFFPVPGDKLVGIIVENKGVVIYPAHHPDIAKFEDQRELWVAVRWNVDKDSKEFYRTKINVTVENRVGALTRVITCIADYGVNIDSITLLGSYEEEQVAYIDLSVTNVNQLNKLITGLKVLDVVITANRII